MLKQDDPRKCSAAKLVKFGLAKPVTRTTSRTLILNPFSEKTLLKSDKEDISLSLRLWRFQKKARVPQIFSLRKEKSIFKGHTWLFKVDIVM